MSDDDFALKVEGLYKVFRLGSKEDDSESLANALFGAFKNPLANYRKYRSLYRFDDIDFDNPDNPENDPNVLWALRGVSFTVKPGELVGIIGHNGAGKSTLLKLLSRISSPSRGTIKLKGRVSSLLEVGTGFHPELTGRENVYLNGTILGMRKKEVDVKFDEIVEFSGVEKFLDTPVKRYSSGMRVRLAFAVAAHLEPEILIVDEVLAVGDANFQKKCLAKMEDVGQTGRTVLFVSHSMPAITRLCPRTILLKQGRVLADGPSHDVVTSYLHGGVGSTAAREWRETEAAPSGDVARLRAVRVRGEGGEILPVANIRKPMSVEIEFEIIKEGYVLLPQFRLVNEEGVHIFTAVDLDPQWRGKRRPTGRYIARATIPGNLLSEGVHYVSVSALTIEPNTLKQFNEREVVAFQVVDSMDTDGARGDWTGNLVGAVRPLLEWRTEYSAA